MRSIAIFVTASLVFSAAYGQVAETKLEPIVIEGQWLFQNAKDELSFSTNKKFGYEKDFIPRELGKIYEFSPLFESSPP
jgi:hypothetical protein